MEYLISKTKFIEHWNRQRFSAENMLPHFFSVFTNGVLVDVTASDDAVFVVNLVIVKKFLWHPSYRRVQIGIWRYVRQSLALKYYVRWNVVNSIFFIGRSNRECVIRLIESHDVAFQKRLGFLYENPDRIASA
jgi:hypothetical protein